MRAFRAASMYTAWQPDDAVAAGASRWSGCQSLWRRCKRLPEPGLGLQDLKLLDPGMGSLLSHLCDETSRKDGGTYFRAN